MNTEDNDHKKGPVPTSAPLRQLCVTGWVFAIHSHHIREDGKRAIDPITFSMGDSEVLYLALFPDEPSLRKFMEKKLSRSDYLIEQIADGDGFLNEMPSRRHGKTLHIIANIEEGSDGYYQYMQLMRN